MAARRMRDVTPSRDSFCGSPGSRLLEQGDMCNAGTSMRPILGAATVERAAKKRRRNRELARKRSRMKIDVAQRLVFLLSGPAIENFAAGAGKIANSFC